MSTPKLVKEASGTFYVYWSAGRRSKRRSTRTSDRKAAETFFRTFIAEGIHELQEKTNSCSMNDLWAEYQERHVEKKVASTDTSRFCWKNLGPFFGRMAPTDITQDAVERYERQRARPRSGFSGSRSVTIPGAKPSTVRRELAVLRACLNWCADPRRDLIDKADVPVFGLPEEGSPRDRWLSLAETQKLLDTAAARRRSPKPPAVARLTRGERFLWIATETAARAGAILELTWDRVDFETNVIHFDVPGRRKTKKRRASVPISRSLRPVLLRAHEERTGNLVLDNSARVWKIVAAIAQAAGVEGVSPHILRHTAATQMARKGVPLWIIANILGNSLTMVEKVYAKHCPEAMARGIDRISDGLLEPFSTVRANLEAAE